MLQSSQQNYNENTQRSSLHSHQEVEQQSQISDGFMFRLAQHSDGSIIDRNITQNDELLLNLLFNYPNLIKLIETSYISVAILDANENVVGITVFNDIPQINTGETDFKHENLWEQWLNSQNFNFYVDEMPFIINSYNTLWLTYYHLNKNVEENGIDIPAEEEAELLRKLFNHVYNTLPNIEGILFLINSEDVIQPISHYLYQQFVELSCINSDILKKTRSLHSQSHIFYSPRNFTQKILEIRMARQEDHDDLAQIFNSQSIAMTSQYGEFFIAELIASQNDRYKAIVAQVDDRAVGLMSLSVEINYRLLASSFDLELYDNLFKPEFMDAIRGRHEEITIAENIQKQRVQRGRIKQLKEETMKCRFLAQRMSIQQYAIDKEKELQEIFETYAAEEQAKLLDKQTIIKILDEWLQEFKLVQPSDFFIQNPTNDTELMCITLSEREFFLDTLVYFGLPKKYIEGEGHWRDWAKKIEEKKKQAMKKGLLASKMKGKKDTKKRGKREEEKKEEEMKPPTYFDLDPLKEAFSKFTVCGAEVRAQFRQTIEDYQKNVISIFSDENGVLIYGRCVDMNTITQSLADQNISINQGLNGGVLSEMLECFAEISCQYQIIKTPLDNKDEQKIDLPNAPKIPKKNVMDHSSNLNNITHKQSLEQGTETAKAFQDYTQKLISLEEFQQAIQKMAAYDQMMVRLGYIKSSKIEKELVIQDQIEKAQEDQLEAAKAQRISTIFDQYVEYIEDLETIPDVPQEAQNAICIHIFCIDQLYESRSIDFLSFAFEQFPDRDYLIITQPYNFPETMLLQNFIQIPKKRNSTFDHVLYIFHKDMLFAPSIKVYLATQKDVTDAQPLIEPLQTQDQFVKDSLEGISHENKSKYTYSVRCNGMMIGLYVLSKDVNLEYYKSHFMVQDHILLNCYDHFSYGRILHETLNPIFLKSTRFILKEIMRLSKKTALFFETNAETLLPPLFNELILTKARKFPKFLERKWDYERDPEYKEKIGNYTQKQDGNRDPLDEEESIFALCVIPKKQLIQNKISNNTRIVVVGASDVGISFLENILSLKNINFTQITLLAPGGTVNMHVNNPQDQLKSYSTNYTLNELRGLMLDSRVTLLDSRMVTLDRFNKCITLDQNVKLFYDVLVLTVGLIDTELQQRQLVTQGIAERDQVIQRNYIRNVFSIDDPYIYSFFGPNKKKDTPIEMLTRKKKPQSIAIYGRNLHTLCFANGLFNRGVHPKRIELIIPRRNYQLKTEFKSHEEKIDYEDIRVVDPDAFDDQIVEDKIIRILEDLGVNIHRDYFIKELYQDKLNTLSGIRIKQADSQGEESELDLNVKLLVTCGAVDIDEDIFRNISNNGLVYNGRLIIKNNFCTIDPAIYASGRICEFSHRYKNVFVGQSLRLDKYNSRELGLFLTNSVLEAIGVTPILDEAETEDLPALFQPNGIWGVLPNDLIYFNVKQLSYPKPKELKNRDDIVCDNIQNNVKGHFIRFSFDQNGIIDGITYLGDEQVSMQSLVSFIGLSETYLNKLDNRFKNGLILNVAEFLSENWAIALYHEFFSEFRAKMKREIQLNEKVNELLQKIGEKSKKGESLTKQTLNSIFGDIDEEVVRMLQNGTLNFISSNINHLPMYYIPGIEFK